MFPPTMERCVPPDRKTLPLFTVTLVDDVSPPDTLKPPDTLPPPVAVKPPLTDAPPDATRREAAVSELRTYTMPVVDALNWSTPPASSTSRLSIPPVIVSP
jgi:hypothetical protein